MEDVHQPQCSRAADCASAMKNCFHIGEPAHCWASSNLLEPTWFVRTASVAGAVGRGSQAKASNPGQTKLGLRLSKGGRELGSIPAGTAGGASSNSWFGETGWEQLVWHHQNL